MRIKRARSQKSNTLDGGSVRASTNGGQALADQAIQENPDEENKSDLDHYMSGEMSLRGSIQDSSSNLRNSFMVGLNNRIKKTTKGSQNTSGMHLQIETDENSVILAPGDQAKLTPAEAELFQIEISALEDSHNGLSLEKVEEAPQIKESESRIQMQDPVGEGDKHVQDLILAQSSSFDSERATEIAGADSLKIL